MYQKLRTCMLFEVNVNLTHRNRFFLFKVIVNQLSWSLLAQYHVHTLAFDESNTTHSQICHI